MKNNELINELNNSTINSFKLIVENKKNIPEVCLKKLNANIFNSYNNDYKTLVFNDKFMTKIKRKAKILNRRKVLIKFRDLKKSKKFSNRILKRKLRFERKVASRKEKIKFNEHKHNLKYKNYPSYKKHYDLMQDLNLGFKQIGEWFAKKFKGKTIDEKKNNKPPK